MVRASPGGGLYMSGQSDLQAFQQLGGIHTDSTFPGT